MDPVIQTTVNNYAAWQFWFSVGTYIVAFAVGIYVWLSNRDKARQQDLRAVEDCASNDIKDVKDTLTTAIENVGSRVTRLEAGMISHSDLGEVHEKINKVSGQVNELSGAVKGIQGGVNMIHEYLLNEGKKQ